VRKTIATLGMAALALAGTARAGEQRAGEQKEDGSSMVARAMAVAEIDFELRLARLGLAGSSLLSEARKAQEQEGPVVQPESTTAGAPGEAPPTAPAAAEPTR
jgi:hypothetical protein